MKRSLAEHDRWLLAHPWQARAITLWLVLAVLVLAEAVKFGLDALGRWIQ
jgi:hypothetical protein